MMKNFLFTGIIGVTVTVSPFISLESPAIAITLRGAFDWETTNQPTTSSGNTVFLFDDNAVDQGIIEFNVTSGVGSGVVFPFSIDSASFTPNSFLEILTFSDSDGNNGTLDLINEFGSIDFDNEISEIAISNLEISVVPEPSTIIGLGVLATFGAVTGFKPKLDKAKKK